MTSLLELVGVALAAFCVWLTVRIIARQEIWAKRTAVGIVAGLPVAYILGFGVACRAIAVPLGGTVKPVPIMDIYLPIGAVAADRDTKAASAIRWYMRIWTPPQGCVLIPSGRGRYIGVFPHNP